MSRTLSVTQVTILGSTGSIGRSALDVVRRYPDRFQVAGLAAHSNVDLLAQQIAEFRPAHVAVVDEAAGARLRAMNLSAKIWTGATGLERLAGAPSDVALCAVVGAAGLKPILRAIETGHRIALANKESLVMAGAALMAHARLHNAEVLPVDSEHNAIFQCLQGLDRADVRCIHLTASGGPFKDRSRDSLRDVTPAEATKHPTWSMGAKISVDSATLMNKGLEVIEAMWLFDLPLSKVEVVVHPQSVVHGMVELNDGSILAQLGVTDMRFPILFALSWPKRVESAMARLDLTAIRELSFAAPDLDAFPCLALALRAAQHGGTAPAVLNAANEVAVAAFCAGRLGFLQIAEVVEQTLGGVALSDDMGLESVVSADEAARLFAEELVKNIGSVR
ncbi:MAG: 1-deoxy-D-xylulose-5-phosphate reductoisomerase [Candidatus Hydrogenedentes bacterium]|nr:1-deoxy-D-xylulose-5-phosphate reductoisomerase [Candidatus Hydrogenedentota bacterium]